VQRCPNCRGTGMQVRMQQLGPGMIQQIQSVCRDCQGQGERIDPKHRCKACAGKKVTRQKKILEVSVDKGMEDGQKITFADEGDQEPGLEPGDIIIVLDEKEHPVFKRQGVNLIMKMHISLSEALTGMRRTVETLDGRTLVVQTVPGEVIKNGEIKCVLGEGMPTYRNPFEKGKLIIQFAVQFPERLEPAMAEKLEKILPQKEEAMIPDDHEEADLNDYDPEEERARRQQQMYEDEEDGHGHGHGPGVGCATQ